jgi:hypothetical protein
LQCKGACERHELGLSQTEGKIPLPFAAYESLTGILHRCDNPEHITAHLFLLLDWNLISRADGVVTSNISIVSMWSDSLRFEIGPTKTNQEGKKHVDHPFHLYSCPENPVICPFLSLCKHLICRPQILAGNCHLFEGSNQYEHLFSVLCSIVKAPEHKHAFIDQGFNPDDFGTHSLRKVQ